MQPTDERREMEELRAEVQTLKAQVAHLQETVRRVSILQRSASAIPSRFLTFRAAARALGLGTSRVRRLVASGALRTIEFPDGARRVPRSELERIDALGLE